jgi:hypothetical protein
MHKEEFPEAQEEFLRIREVARRSEDVLGFVVTGSRGKGCENEWSDYDFAIFVDDGALENYRERYEASPYGAHLYIFSPDSFKKYTAWGTGREWDRYTWAHLKVEYDRTGGELQKLLDETGRVPTEQVEKFINYSLRWFMNQAYHSLKCLRLGNATASHVEAAEGIKPFLQAVFCLHDRRVAPFYRYLDWELENYPLDKLEIDSSTLSDALLSIVKSGDYRAQQLLLREAERIFQREGFTSAFHSWRHGYKWILSFSP